MKTRVLSGLIMAPLLAILYFGGYILFAACFLIGIMAVKEFYNGFKAMDIKPNFGIAVVATVVLYAIDLFTDDPQWYMLWFFGAVLISLLYLFNIEHRKLEDAMATITGIVYVVFFSFHVTLVDQTGDCSNMVWLIVITAFGTDIMAYFSGFLFGKNKLCPKISPKKTIEGAIGGTIGSIVLSGIFGYFVMPEMLVHCLVIGLLGSIVAQFGDLTASIFKRKMGIKDYGNLIPGHGGILDRFDSVLFTGPIIYYYIVLVIGSTAA